MPGVVSWLLFAAAMISLVAFGLLVVVALEILSLIREIRKEVLPVIGSAQQTVRTVQGTSEFVSSGLVKPLITSVSVSAGVARTVQVLGSSVAHAFRRAPRAAVTSTDPIAPGTAVASGTPVASGAPMLEDHAEVVHGQRK
jgi:hypothetical protein